MTRLLFINTTLSWNKGSAAQVSSTCDAVRECDEKAGFSLLSYCPTLDAQFEKHCRVSVVGYPDDEGLRLGDALRAYGLRIAVALLSAFAIRIIRGIGGSGCMFAKERFCKEILRSDAVIDLSGDSLSDRGSHSVINLMGILLCVILEKQVVCYSQSMGPFTRWTEPFAKLILERTNAITVREQLSYDYLMRIGVSSTKLDLFADCAFNLRAADENRIAELLSSAGIRPDEANQLIGISVSALTAELQMKELPGSKLSDTPYIRTLVSIASTIRKRDPDTHLLLVPHVIAPMHWCKDDRWACSEFAKLLAPDGHVHTLPFDYTAEELKGIIGACDFFIGSRMHACIAALSQTIPTVALSWSHKYLGIMDRLGMKEYVLDSRMGSPEEFAERAEEAFHEREAISARLTMSVKAEKSSAKEGVNTILNLLN